MRCKGYTLVELLVVTGVSVLLVTGAMTLYLSSYSELGRESSTSQRLAALDRTETVLCNDLRRMVRAGHESLTLDVSGDTSTLELSVLDTAPEELPSVTAVAYALTRGKDTLLRRAGAQSSAEELQLPAALDACLAVDSLGREQLVWLWDEITPRGLVIELGPTPDDDSPSRLWFFMP